MSNEIQSNVTKIVRKIDSSYQIQTQVREKISGMIDCSGYSLWNFKKNICDIYNAEDTSPLFVFKTKLTGKLEAGYEGLHGEFLLIKNGNENAISLIQLFTHECRMKNHFVGIDESKYWCYNECDYNCLTKGVTLYQNLTKEFNHLVQE